MKYRLIKKMTFESMISQSKKHQDETDSATSIIKEIEKGNLSVNIDSENMSPLMTSLVSMKSKMQQIAQEEAERNWINIGFTKFSEMLRLGSENFQTLCSELISELVKYLNANQGGLFLVSQSDKNTETYIELVAAYAYGRSKYIKKKIAPGDGLIGQAFWEKEIIYMTDVPMDYLKITSGLGEALPRNIVIVPLKVEQTVYGIIELASFQKIAKHQLQFLEKLGETIGSTIASVRVSERTKKLLKETQLQAEQLKSQEEEMRQNMEELHATQESIERKQQETLQESNKLKAILDSSLNAIITMSEQGIVESVNKSFTRIFGYLPEEIIGQNINKIVPLPHHENHDGYTQNYVNSGIANIIGQQRELVGTKKDGTQFHIELSVNIADLGDRDIFTVIIQDITKRQEAEEERQQSLEELRAQEEELRQNMEELGATQEEMSRQMVEIDRVKRALEERESVFSKTTILSEADTYGTITYVNKKLCEVSKYSEKELIGKGHNIFRHPDMPKELFIRFWKTIRNGETFQGIIKNKGKDGTVYWVDATIIPILDDKGKIRKYIGARYHITDEALALQLYNQQAKTFGLPLLTQ